MCIFAFKSLPHTLVGGVGGGRRDRSDQVCRYASPVALPSSSLYSILSCCTLLGCPWKRCGLEGNPVSQSYPFPMWSYQLFMTEESWCSGVWGTGDRGCPCLILCLLYAENTLDSLNCMMIYCTVEGEICKSTLFNYLLPSELLCIYFYV